MRELRGFLASTIDGQTDYIVARLEGALPKMLAAVPASEREKVRARFYEVASSPQGVYALIDYVNFKGEGTNPSERYNGQGWGMLQVLQGMEPGARGQGAATEFGRSAARVLARRVQNAPASRNEGRWLEGWRNRCMTYGRPL